MNSTAICVLGMHRSGTSTVMRAINLLGVYVGEDADLMAATSANPEGYWERNDVWQFHEELLAALKTTWDTVAPLPENWHLRGDIQPYREHLRELILREFGNKVLWGWKDPRTCLTLPLWQDVLAELGIRLGVIFVSRNPLDTAKSLARRDNFPLAKGLGIWLNYNLHAAQTLAGVTNIVVFYDRFLQDWEDELKRCSSNLSIPWPTDNSKLKRDMNNFINPSLRHSKSNSIDLSIAPHPVLEMYSIIEKGCLGSPLDFDRVDRLRSEYFDYASFFQEYMLERWDLSEKITELQGRTNNLTVALSGEKMKLSERETQLRGIEHQLAITTTKLEKILGSASWRITAPIRTILDKMLK